MLEKVILSPDQPLKALDLGDFNLSLEKLLAPFDFPKRFAIAVSGGCDSMALLQLMNQLSMQQSFEITALTVDHGLRPEAALEAENVHNWCKSQNIKHHTLHWHHQGISSRIQEQARNARYDLLSQWCKTHNYKYLVTAHHFDDQLETTTMRVLKNSGLRGLAGMSGCRPLGEIYHLRPLLNLSKQSLRDLVAKENIPFFEDPSNQNPLYDRGRLRYSNAEIYPIVQPIQKTCASFRNIFEKHLQSLLKSYFHIHPLGFATLDLELTDLLPETFLKDLLSFLFQNLQKNMYPAPDSSLERMARNMRTLKQYPGNLRGIIVLKHQSKWYFIWDQKTLPHPFLQTDENWQAITEQGWQALCDHDPLIKDLPFPKKALMASLAPFARGKLDLEKSLVKQFHDQKGHLLQKNLLFLPLKPISSFIFVEN